ncbi:uncharacterized protein A1O9_00371 [Exophiala aquamarina CBS 119918]|uniref:Aldehyde dehydrogenase domain-containing protein n=1 Tax=Exophiala aquamarina CBS 119918 TaxID=1182545 RepID=A0A072PQM2_9EURO|nr:uncharacterized protein A1O9_00371 [Exophiala aquamarina CBS 119918]KEF62399.1 hypothetical protein A1O9_00371 [Exophiala aquamarina CBS 119918]
MFEGAETGDIQAVCTATKRTFFHEYVYAESLQAMVRHTQTMKTGSSIIDKDVKLGPV